LPVFQGRNTIRSPAPVAQWTEQQPSKLVVTKKAHSKNTKKAEEIKKPLAFRF
jgi:hypothetical protein